MLVNVFLIASSAVSQIGQGTWRTGQGPALKIGALRIPLKTQS